MATLKNYRISVPAADGASAILINVAGSNNANGQARPATKPVIVHSLHLANINGADTKLVNVAVYSVSNFFVLYQVPVPPGSTLSVDKVINLESTDMLKVWSDGAGNFDAIASVTIP